MKIAIATLLAALSLSTLVKADVGHQYRTSWTFTEVIGFHYEDYSTNLGIPLGATLPVKTVKAGWACVREPVVIGGWIQAAKSAGYEDGVWSCTNGQETAVAHARCTLDKINTDYGSLDLKVPGGEDGLRFSVSCAND